MGIRPPRLFDNKKENDFRGWVRRLERYFALVNLPGNQQTSLLLLNLATEASSTARYLKIDDDTTFAEAKRRLIQHYSPQEEPLELRSRFQVPMQESGETIEDFAKDIRVLAARAFPDSNDDMLNVLLVQQFVHGLHDPVKKERLILKRCKDLQEALNCARLSEVANKAVRGSKGASIFKVDEATAAAPTPQAEQQASFASSGSYRGRGNQFRANIELAVVVVHQI